MSHADRTAETIAAIDEAIAEWEAWKTASHVAGFVEEHLGLTLPNWQRRWLKRVRAPRASRL